MFDILVLLAWISGIAGAMTIWQAIKRWQKIRVVEEIRTLEGLAQLAVKGRLGYVDLILLRNRIAHLKRKGPNVAPANHFTRSKRASALGTRLASHLPEELRPYAEEIEDYLQDGVRERRAEGKPTKPFIVSHLFQLTLTIVKTRLRLTITRKWTIR